MEHGLASLYGKRVLIRADGSHSIGLGHIYRMKTLALTLQEYGCAVAFVSQFDPVTSQLLKSAELTSHWFNPDSYNLVLAEAIRDHQPDVIIQDILETSSRDLTELRDLTCAKIVNFDDVGAGLAIANVVINSIVFHWGRYRTDESRARLFEGPRYMIMNPAIKEYSSLSKNIAGYARKILLAFGGTDTHNVTERTLQALNMIETSLFVTINMGPGSKPTLGLERMIQNSPHQIQILRATPNLFEEFFQADLVICGGGIMLYELAAMGIPAVSIPTEPHEVSNAVYWSKVGTITALDYERNLQPLQVTELVSSLLPDYPRRAALSTIGKSAMDISGLDRVMQIVDEVMS